MQGHCDSGFGRVADVFASQLSNGRDVGGSVGVYLDGKPVVTIWGGSADPDHSVPWTEHTVTPIGSTGKALASTALLILVDRGLVDLDAEVLAGARTNERELSLRRLLGLCDLLGFDSVLDFDGAVAVYRTCRQAGVTPRGLLDCMIAAVAIGHDIPLLAWDADMVRIADVTELRLDLATVKD